MKNQKFTLIAILIIQLISLPVPSIGSESWQEAPPLQATLNELKCTFPDKQWWQQFKDPFLTGYIENAINENQDLKIALERINESNALARYALGQEFPQATINDAYFRVNGSKNFLSPQVSQLSQANSSLLTGGSTNVYILPVIARYELDLFRVKRNQTRSAEKTAKASEFDYQTVLINLTASVATAYFNLLLNDKLLKLQNELLINLRQILELRISLFIQGQISYDDVLITEESIAQTESNIAEQEKMQGMLVHQISVLTGTPPISQIKFARNDIDCICLNKEIQTGVPSELIRRRPDILSAETQLQKAGIDVKVARGQFFPTIDAIGTFGYASSDLRKFFDWSSNTEAIGAIIRQTLFTGGSKMANLKANKARCRSAAQNYQKTILTAFQEVEDSLSRLNADIKQYKQSEVEIRNSKQILTLTNNRFQGGINSTLDVLNAEQQLITFKQNQTQSKGNILIDNISLYKALGGGF